MKVQTLRLTTALLISAFTQAMSWAVDVRYEVHVQTGAAAGGDGSVEKPFATISAARDFLRTVEKPKGSVFRVLVGDGVYKLEQPLDFDARDSGPQDGATLYTAADGARPILSGGQAVSGWTDGGNGIWSADVGKMRFRQIYVGGRSGTRARYPNSEEFLRIDKPFIKDRYVTIATSFANNWEQFHKVEMHVTMLWAEAILRLKSFQTDPKNAERTQVRFHEP